MIEDNHYYRVSEGIVNAALVGEDKTFKIIARAAVAAAAGDRLSAQALAEWERVQLGPVLYIKNLIAQLVWQYGQEITDTNEVTDTK